MSASIVALAACGSTGAGPTSAIPTTPVTQGPVTVSLSGTTRQTSVNGCSGDSHSVTMSEGDVQVTLVETSDPAGALSVQVCAGTVDTGICSIKQQRTNVGQTLAGVRVGAAGQLLKMLPFACVFATTFDPTPITYKVSLTYQQ